MSTTSNYRDESIKDGERASEGVRGTALPPPDNLKKKKNPKHTSEDPLTGLEQIKTRQPPFDRWRDIESTPASLGGL